MGGGPTPATPIVIPGNPPIRHAAARCQIQIQRSRWLHNLVPLQVSVSPCLRSPLGGSGSVPLYLPGGHLATGQHMFCLRSRPCVAWLGIATRFFHGAVHLKVRRQVGENRVAHARSLAYIIAFSLQRTFVFRLRSAEQCHANRRHVVYVHMTWPGAILMMRMRA